MLVRKETPMLHVKVGVFLLVVEWLSAACSTSNSNDPQFETSEFLRQFAGHASPSFCEFAAALP